MSQSLAQIYLHIVFSTKVRIPFLKEKKVRDDLYAYMAGICKNLDSPAQMVGGGRGSCALALPPFEEFGAVAFSAGVEKGLVKVGENSGGCQCPASRRVMIIFCWNYALVRYDLSWPTGERSVMSSGSSASPCSRVRRVKWSSCSRR